MSRAAKIRAMRIEHPNMTVAEVAEKCKVKTQYVHSVLHMMKKKKALVEKPEPIKDSRYDIVLELQRQLDIQRIIIGYLEMRLQKAGI